MEQTALKQGKERKRITVTDAVDEINQAKALVTAVQEMSQGQGPYSLKARPGCSTSWGISIPSCMRLPRPRL